MENIEVKAILIEYLKEITDTDRVRTEAEIQSVPEIAKVILAYT